ncbi:MAG TPA: glycosyltransferase [Polyangiaceae bacterium LLY-WYZ-14_1]|nr:glycosyltransferase [Polyangiaceae bacterium LLY-WYZ-14_1]
MTTTHLSEDPTRRDAPEPTTAGVEGHRRAASREGATTAPAREWPRRIGLMNDYLRVPWANGSSFASQFLYRRFRELGHEVVLMGPREGADAPDDLPPNTITFPAAPLRASGMANDGEGRVGLWLPFPGRKALDATEAADLDVVIGQTSNELVDLGVWLRWRQGVPFLIVNTLHIASAYNALLPNFLLRNRAIHGFFRDRLIPWVERHTAKVHNESDGLVVLSEGLADYWRARGVTVPIHVIPRSVDPEIFDAPVTPDPFPGEAKKGGRILCVCRHAREKEVDRLIELFARYVAPASPSATLTLVGDGPEHEELKALAAEQGVEDRVFFIGEVAIRKMPSWYRHADVFVYASLSETYGQVISEASWCGLPVVAFADGMGVSSQLAQGETGILVDPGPDREVAHWHFAKEVVAFLRQPRRREVFGRAASARARERAAPERVLDRHFEVFEAARQHCRETWGKERHRERRARRALLRWRLVQALAVAAGALRPPPTVNRRGVRPPSWGRLDKSAAR